MNTNHRDTGRAEFTEARLTAYALGQLGEQERAAVEAQLVRNDKARRRVEEIRVLGKRVVQSARLGPPLQPSDELREAVERRLRTLEDRPMSTPREPLSPEKREKRLRLRRILLVAAGLLIVATPLYLVALVARSIYDREESDLASRSSQSTPADSTAFSVAGDQGKIDGSVRSSMPEGRQAPRGQSASGSAREAVAYAETKKEDARGGPAALGLARSAPQSTEDGDLRMMVTPRVIAEGEADVSLFESLSSDGRSSDVSSPSSYDSFHLLGIEAKDRGEVSGKSPDRYGYEALLQKGFGRVESLYESMTRPAPSQSPPATSPEVRLITSGGSQSGATGYGTAGTSHSEKTYYEAKGRTLRLAEEEAKPAPAAGPDNIRTGQSLHYLTPESEALGDALESMAPKLSTSDLAHKRGLERLSRQKPMADVPSEPAADVDFLAFRNLHHGRERGRTEFALHPDVPGTEQYEAIAENPFLSAEEHPLSTFSIDVDTASYANVRRFLNQGRLPPPQAVRIEEMVNYFQYDYPPPEDDVPFAVHTEVAQCPFNGDHRLVRIGLKGQEIDRSERGPSSLVFLLDVSGSMRDADKLPLVKQAMTLLVDQLTEDDRVAIVTYASNAGVQLESTGGHDRQRIRQAIDALQAGGSTHGSAGIQLAYRQAANYFVQGGTNRVILATDGDLNVGITDDDELVELIKEKAAGGVFLTVLGFGTGNLKDAKMEKLADHGNGVYAYIDNLREARRLLVEQLSGSLVTIAKDVKIQIEFNPAEVDRYRLIGYENRIMAARDFGDDKKDAGEIGAGHTVTALYEIVPAGGERAATDAQPELKYQRRPKPPLTRQAASGELLSLRLRYKLPEAQQSKLLEFVARDSDKRFGEASADFRFASAVASFGMVLRGSSHSGGATFEAVEEFAAGAVGDDPQGYRTELVDLVRRARQLRPR